MDKLEKHVKNSLNKRQINPSSKAWEKIESQLGDSKSRKQRLPIIWYAAAAIIGIILVSTMYRGSEAPEKEIQIVNAQDDGIEDNEKEINVVFDKKLDTANDPIKEEQLEVKQPLIFNDNINEEVAVQEPILDQNDSMAKNEQFIIDQKVNEVFAKVALLENANSALTDAEVDSLLRAAQNEILTDKIFEDNGTVDAMALLTEVEGELDRSFRDQLFEALKEGYTKLKTAVADRNN